MIDLIIPIYNARDTLELTLKSIKIQTIIDKINIYLIDDYSDYEYKDILNKYNDMNIIYKRLDSNKGPGQARQYGIDISNSEYIMFIDSDDLFFSSESVNELYDEIIKGYDYVIGITHEEKRDIYLYNEGDLHGKIYRREFIEKNNIKFNNTRFHEDNLFNNLVLVHDPKKIRLESLVYIYVDNNKSITNIDKSKEFDRLEILLSNMHEFLQISKQDKCRRELVIFLIFIKIKYFNRIYKEFDDTQKDIFIKWIKKYNLNIDKYLGNDNFEQIEKDMYNKYNY